MENNQVWQALKLFQLDKSGSEYTFSERLSKENEWSKPFAIQCIEEYKRFMFLSVFAGHPVTPSKAVDEVWHLHLIYTKSYWEEMCEGILGKKVHHNPTEGGIKEDTKYANYYQMTLDSYKKFFGDPPNSIWTGQKKIDKKQMSVSDAFACITPIALLAFIDIQNPFFLILLGIAVICLVIIAFILIENHREEKRREDIRKRNKYMDHSKLPTPSASAFTSKSTKGDSKKSSTNNNDSCSSGFIPPVSCSSSDSSHSSDSGSSCSSSSCGSSCGGGGCGGD